MRACVHAHVCVSVYMLHMCVCVPGSGLCGCWKTPRFWKVGISCFRVRFELSWVKACDDLIPVFSLQFSHVGGQKICQHFESMACHLLRVSLPVPGDLSNEELGTGGCQVGDSGHRLSPRGSGTFDVLTHSFICLGTSHRSGRGWLSQPLWDLNCSFARELKPGAGTGRDAHQVAPGSPGTGLASLHF